MTDSIRVLGAAMIGGLGLTLSAGVHSQPPIVQPGPPGAPSRNLLADEAIAASTC